jgi:hypothetical protein
MTGTSPYSAQRGVCTKSVSSLWHRTIPSQPGYEVVVVLALALPPAGVRNTEQQWTFAICSLFVSLPGTFVSSFMFTFCSMTYMIDLFQIRD